MWTNSLPFYLSPDTGFSFYSVHSLCFGVNSNVRLTSNLQELIIWVIIVCFGEFSLPEL